MELTSSSYWLCTTPRSGSSLLCDILSRTGVAGTPTEYFNSRFWPNLFSQFSVTSEADYFASLPRNTATSNGVFGVKVMLDKDMSPTFRVLRKIAGVPNLSDAETARCCFPGVKLIFLTRRDKVSQAVSYCRARQSGVWNRYSGEGHPDSFEPIYDFGEIRTQVNDLVLREAMWQTFFDCFREPPLTLIYEDYIRGPEAAVTSVLDFLDLASGDWSMPPLPMEKLGDATSAAWAQRYVEESQR